MNNFTKITPTKHGWKYGYGFFSNYRICLEELIAHHESNNSEIPYVDWSNTTWVEGFNPFESKNIPPHSNPFDQWFEQPTPNQTDIITLNSYPPSKYGTIIDHSQDYFNSDELKRQQTIDRLYLKPKQFILDQINTIYQKEFKDEIVLGVMLRGTEYPLHHPFYGKFTIEDYIGNIKDILTAHPEITKIFVASEDGDYISRIQEEFPLSYSVPNVFRKTDETLEYINRVHCWPNVSTKRKNHCKLLGEETIIQTKLLGKCPYLFGMHSGIFAGAILWNENIQKIYKI